MIGLWCGSSYFVSEASGNLLLHRFYISIHIRSLGCSSMSHVPSNSHLAINGADMGNQYVEAWKGHACFSFLFPSFHPEQSVWQRVHLKTNMKFTSITFIFHLKDMIPQTLTFQIIHSIAKPSHLMASSIRPRIMIEWDQCSLTWVGRGLDFSQPYQMQFQVENLCPTVYTNFLKTHSKWQK